MVFQSAIRSHKRPLKETKDEPHRSSQPKDRASGKLQGTVLGHPSRSPRHRRVYFEEICGWDACLLSEPQDSQDIHMDFERITLAKSLPAWSKRDKDSSK